MVEYLMMIPMMMHTSGCKYKQAVTKFLEISNKNLFDLFESVEGVSTFSFYHTETLKHSQDVWDRYFILGIQVYQVCCFILLTHVHNEFQPVS